VKKGRFKVESSKFNGERERAEEAQRWRRDDGVVGRGQRLRFIRNGSMIVTICQYHFIVYCMVIRTGRVHSNERGGSCGIGRSWRGG
jgi:hypothetical protein